MLALYPKVIFYIIWINKIGSVLAVPVGVAVPAEVEKDFFTADVDRRVMDKISVLDLKLICSLLLFLLAIVAMFGNWSSLKAELR